MDILSCESELNAYKVIVLPMLYMIKPGVMERLDAYVKNGGTLIATAMSGLVDENDQLPPEDYPAFLRKILGLRIEETDALLQGCENAVELDGRSYACRLVCDVIHTEGAQTLGRFEREFYAGSPAVTVNRYGRGQAYYIGTQPEQALIDHLVDGLGLAPVLASDGDTEITKREDENRVVYFVLNHGGSDARVVLPQGAYTDLLNGTPARKEVTVKPNDVGVFMAAKER